MSIRTDTPVTRTLDAPLTFGQLPVWRSLQALPVPRRLEGNVPRTWPVPVDPTPAQVALAWHALVIRHESLRTLFVRDGSTGLRQRWAGPIRLGHRRRSCSAARWSAL